MPMRLPYFELSPEALAGLRAVNTALDNSPLGRELIELVYLRISQINGCAFCLKKHTKALRELGTAPEKLDTLAGWHHASTTFSARESAALAWAECITHISQSHAPDEVFQALRQQFNDKEISDLTFAASHMNALNRLAIAMRQ